MLPYSYQPAAAIVLVIGGAIACFAGYRLFRTVLAIYGFILGALMASSMMGSTNTVGMIAAAIVGGIAGAIVLTFAYFVGIAQKLPWSGKLALKGQQAESERNAVAWDVQDVQLRLLESARVAYVAAAHSLEQIPQYVPIHYAGHEGGDFLFVPSTN